MDDLLTQEQLDNMQCAIPGCSKDHGPLYLHGRCHIEAPTEVVYFNGELMIACAECQSPIARIAVAESLVESTA